jgi:hypothetical protein
MSKLPPARKGDAKRFLLICDAAMNKSPFTDSLAVKLEGAKSMAEIRQVIDSYEIRRQQIQDRVRDDTEHAAKQQKGKR